MATLHSFPASIGKPMWDAGEITQRHADAILGNALRLNGLLGREVVVYDVRDRLHLPMQIGVIRDAGKLAAVIEYF